MHWEQFTHYTAKHDTHNYLYTYQQKQQQPNMALRQDKLQLYHNNFLPYLKHQQSARIIVNYIVHNWILLFFVFGGSETQQIWYQ